MTAASGKAEGGADMWFRVEVMDSNGQIVAIESESLAGRDIGESEEETIKKSILNLCGFIGWHPEFVPTPAAANGPGEESRGKFEAWVSAMPYERPIDRWPTSGRQAWPGQYKDIAVQLAWEAVSELASTPQPGMVTVPREQLRAVEFAASGYCPACGGWEVTKGQGCQAKVHTKTCWLDAALRSGEKGTP